MSSFTEKAQGIVEMAKGKIDGSNRTNLKAHSKSDFEPICGEHCKSYQTAGHCLMNEPCRVCESNQHCRLHEPGYVYEASKQHESC